MGRILALDIGSVRIGLAMTDESQIITRPLDQTVPPSEVVEAIKNLVEEYELEKIIVGKPLTMSGEEGGQFKEVDMIVERIKQNVDLPVEYIDERLTTKAASNIKNSGSSAPLDSLAAQQILETYLSQKQNTKTQNNEPI